jgi:hypothetical protein
LLRVHAGQGSFETELTGCAFCANLIFFDGCSIILVEKATSSAGFARSIAVALEFSGHVASRTAHASSAVNVNFVFWAECAM